MNETANPAWILKWRAVALRMKCDLNRRLTV
jgi:hypothetical protein